ncbi:MAG: hypothetical protein JHC73_18795 [Dolichospermum sp.]|nr:hypothetical protein [Dolichospermum sp.]
MAHLGVTHYNPFAQDPDYPKATTAVSDATAIKFNGLNPFEPGKYPTSSVGSKPTTGDPKFNNAFVTPENPNGFDYGLFLQSQYLAGEGPNPALSKALYGVTPPKQTTPPKTTKTTNSTSSTSGTGGMTAAEALAFAKFNYEKEQDALKLGGLQNYADSGSYNTGFNNLLKMITDQGGVSKTGITDAYGRATTNINQGFNAAQGLGDSGYAALNKYLGENPNNPYAGMEATVGSAPDALTQYLSSYGVSDQPVRGQIQADQLQAQQGAGNYQNLIDILSSVAQSGASSRGAESVMGQNLFDTSLGQERAGYQGQASNAQAQALAALQQQMFQSRFGVENDRNSLANQIAQALAAAGGKTNTPGTNTTVTDPTTTTTGFTPSTSYDVNRPVPTIQQANLIRNMPGQDPNELLQMLNARRGY